MRTVSAAGVAGAVLLSFVASTSVHALECPLPQTGTVQGTLPQSSEDIARLGERLSVGSQGNATNEIIYEVRKKYPDATADEIVNYLITAYCPIVASKPGVTDKRAEAELKAFGVQVMKIVTQ